MSMITVKIGGKMETFCEHASRGSYKNPCFGCCAKDKPVLCEQLPTCVPFMRKDKRDIVFVRPKGKVV